MNESLLIQISIPQLKLLVQESLSVELKKLNLSLPEKELDANLSRKEAAKYLGVSERSISNYVKNGKLSGSRLGVFLKFKKSDLDKALTKIRTIKYGRENNL